MSISSQLAQLNQEIGDKATLIAVSKTKPVAMLKEAYDAGQRHFGENYVQELVEKQPQLPADIQWHFIGHLQSNKVKYIAPFVHCIHAVDSFKLLAEINKQAAKHQRVIDCLLQLHVAQEESKFGWSTHELIQETAQFNFSDYPNVRVVGVMGMASFTNNEQQIRDEFKNIASTFHTLKNGCMKNNSAFTQLSMGMSSDWKIALEEGSTMLRIGSTIFGSR
jgi:pyridoxal phosphate enzyme (YggS family)